MTGAAPIDGPWSALRRAPMVRFIVPFVAGMLVAWRIQPDLLVSTWILVIMTPAVIAVLLLPTVRSMRWRRGLAIGSWFFCFGIHTHIVHLPANDPLHVSRSPEQHAIWALRIEAVNGVTEKLVRADGRLIAVADREGTRAVHGLVMLSLMRSSSAPVPVVGDRMWVQATMEPIARIADPGGFDRRGWAASRGISWEAFVGSDDQLFVDRAWQWTDMFISARQHVSAWLTESGLPLRERALVKALVLGERDELDGEQKNAFARSGTIHVLAVSGMHVGLIYGVLFFLSGWWGQNTRARWIRGVVILLALWGYAGLTGASASVLRATVMFTLFTLAGMAQQRTNHLNSLFASALVLLVWDPGMLNQMGFQLSFLAVLGIILFYGPLLHWWSPKNKVLRYLWSLAAVSLAAQTLTTPLSLFSFKAFPVWFLPANIVVVSAAGLAVYGAVALLILYKVPWIGAALTWVMTQLLALVGWSTDLFAGLPGAYPAVRTSFWEMVLMYILVLAGAAWWRWRWSGMKWITMASLAGLFVSWGVRAGSSHDRSAFVVYDEQRDVLAGMVTGRELAVIASSDSLLRSERTRLKFERHQRAAGLESSFTGLISDGQAGVVPIASTMLAAGRWRSSRCDVYFSTGDPPPPDRGRILDVIVLHDVKYIEDHVLEEIHDRTRHVVLAGSMPWRVRDHVVDWCAEHQLTCHDVRANGAFILEP